MSAGPAALLPHLARSKAVVQTAKFRALWALQQGRQTDAREELVAALVLGRNGARDGTLISTLVQIAVESIDCRTVAELFGQFSPENLQQLLDGFDAAPARRTVADCIATEKAFFLDWIVRRIVALQQANPGDDAKVMNGIRELLASALEAPADGEQPLPANSWERIVKAAGGTSAGVVRLIHELEPHEQQLAVVLALPHGEYEGRMEQLMAEIQRSPNPLLALLFPPWEKVRSRDLMGLMNLAMVRAAVEYKLHGQAGLQTVTDPWGQGPFEFQRFVFQGVDRGFELKSACRKNGWPEVLIFVEKDGPPFYVNGRNAGQARPATYPK
jgi:hypothetical protein